MRIAQIAISEPRCSRCGQPGILDWRTHKIWHQAAGGTEQFSLGHYDLLLEVR